MITIIKLSKKKTMLGSYSCVPRPSKNSSLYVQLPHPSVMFHYRVPISSSAICLSSTEQLRYRMRLECFANPTTLTLLGLVGRWCGGDGDSIYGDSVMWCGGDGLSLVTSSHCQLKESRLITLSIFALAVTAQYIVYFAQSAANIKRQNYTTTTTTTEIQTHTKAKIQKHTQAPKYKST